MHTCMQAVNTQWYRMTNKQTHMNRFFLCTQVQNTHASKHTESHTHRNGHSLLGFLAAAIIDTHRQVMDQPQPLCDLDLFLLRQLTRWPTDVGWRMVDGDNLGFLQGDEWEDLLQRVPVMYRWWERGFATDGTSNVQLMSERICYRVMYKLHLVQRYWSFIKDHPSRPVKTENFSLPQWG